jgi:hypothetical protein
MGRMTIAPGLSFDLTPEEARTLTRALTAVTRDNEVVTDIYLSPIASDGDFSAKVAGEGLEIAGNGAMLRLSWQDVALFAERLAVE